MKPIIDPRDGDIEDDASSTKRRSLFSLAGSLLAEISLPKLVIAWMLLIGLPGIMLGVAPLIVSLWLSAATSKVSCHSDRHLADRAPGGAARPCLVRRAPAASLDRKQLLVAECPGGAARLRRLSRGAPASRRGAASAGRERGGAGIGPRGQRRGVGPGDQCGLVLGRRARLAGFALGRQSRGLRIAAPARHDRAGERRRDRRRLFRRGGVRLGHGRRDDGAAARPACPSTRRHAAAGHGASRICPTSTPWASATASGSRAEGPARAATSGCGWPWRGWTRSTRRIRSTRS